MKRGKYDAVMNVMNDLQPKCVAVYQLAGLWWPSEWHITDFVPLLSVLCFASVPSLTTKRRGTTKIGENFSQGWLNWCAILVHKVSIWTVFL